MYLFNPRSAAASWFGRAPWTILISQRHVDMEHPDAIQAAPHVEDCLHATLRCVHCGASSACSAALPRALLLCPTSSSPPAQATPPPAPERGERERKRERGREGEGEDGRNGEREEERQRESERRSCNATWCAMTCRRIRRTYIAISEPGAGRNLNAAHGSAPVLSL